MATSTSTNQLDKKLYKTLMTDIAAQLSDSDIRKLAYQNDINNYSDALDLFTQLEKLGCIGRDKLSELEDILTGINRNDLVAQLKETISKNEGKSFRLSIILHAIGYNTAFNLSFH